MADTKLLVVEDESIVAMDIKHRAEGLGYNVLDIAASGEEAIEKARETEPDLILMDIVLKGKMDGIEAADFIRDEFDIPVVYLTAYSDEKTLGRAKLTGPFGYIIKPFEDRELHSAVEVALYKHKMDSKLRESEERYRSLFESSPDPILLLNVDGSISFMNRQIEKITGIRRKKLMGKPLLEFSNLGFMEKRQINDFLSLIPSLIEKGRMNPLELSLNDKNGKHLYFEIHASYINSSSPEPLIQLIGHDITDRIKSEKQREELIREKARVELYGFVVSAVPVFASSIPPQLRNTIIKNFADRFEKNVKPNFYEEMNRQDLIKVIEDKNPERKKEVFDAYLEWIQELLLNLGIQTSLKESAPKYRLKFETFPWMDEARKNPIFSLIFRAIMIRSFTWTGIKGNVNQCSSLIEGSKKMQFEFYVPL
ncbi:methanogen output domain 1-containing protein [Methanobacterium alkalithermotolerans]|uniref:Methanogen output domain 1-containing protein n=1 Tax=Methanobacterium alkalithermotolerans TaxID=2731220 RepID=A0A8T8KAN6_9EURY|nr:methanogen output domain 1-containing protein [Methanobacterium alkalithermotolerans]QUH22471.1 methanogen output domain 1-containing protein [Methanobacterium alkalithermotolerans]